ncbi:hypothetical protein SAMN04489725_11089 [Alicyclobacillus hesperidum]|uniref:Uncharacterized protein n=1 Tax=Alicyclobacillus hesperidum TaxID=89784 RepID=A0A1H2VC45_9BACL|nr:hypothetical protein SAMN04489725_11089 [Alicyclobacillus hesperidum]
MRFLIRGDPSPHAKRAIRCAIRTERPFLRLPFNVPGFALLLDMLLLCEQAQTEGGFG